MPHIPLTTRQLRGALIAACAALVVIAGSSSLARAQADDDEEDVPYDTKILRGIMSGLGLKRDGEGPNIDYRERSPLVVPPSINLPPPETAGSTPTAANWPVDADESRRKKAIAARKKAAATRRSAEDEWRVLSPGELAPGAGTAEARRHPKPQSGRGSPDDDLASQGRQSSVWELGYKGGLFSSMFGKDEKNETVKFQGEPTRDSLTEPPVGYRTPSPAQPYGVAREAKKGQKPMDVIDRQTPLEDRK